MKKTPKPNKDFTTYLTEPTEEEIFLRPVHPLEIENIILANGNSNACGSHSIPTRILKECRFIFSHLLAILINKSFIDGTFPELLKLANVIAIFKKSTAVAVQSRGGATTSTGIFTLEDGPYDL